MTPFQRALVIGCSGAGKSTFAARLAQRSGLPLVHLDREFWLPGWVEPRREDWRRRVAGLVAPERWIIEGNYPATLDLRLPRADLVVWLDYSRPVCLGRVILRSVRSYGRVRADLAPGCPEQFDLAFYRDVWRFPRSQRPRIVAALAEHGRHLRPVMLRRDGEAERFLAGLARPEASVA